MKLIVANWKMFGNEESIQAWAQQLAFTSHTLVLCPQALLIPSALKYRQHYCVGAQDCHYEGEGPYTGCTSPALLADMGCRYVILGHSERRAFESDTLIHQKAEAATRYGLTPILCVGEPLNVREQGDHITFVQNQLAIMTHGLRSPYYIPYEPLWAIGTGTIPTTLAIEEMHVAIKKYRGPVPVLYGGSVNSNNSRGIIHLASVDGLLIGGASLTPPTFNPILHACEEK